MLVHCRPASSIIIYMPQENSKPVPDIKIESYIFALFLNDTFDPEKIMQNAEQGQMVPSIEPARNKSHCS